MSFQVLRTGIVSSINRDAGTARVTYEDRDGSTSGELPFLAWMFWMPSIGDAVLVGHLSSGAGDAVIIGPIWNEAHTPEDFSDDEFHQELGAKPGEAWISYWNEILTIHAKNILFDDPGEENTVTVKQLLQEIDDLKGRCSGLERRVSALESRI